MFSLFRSKPKSQPQPTRECLPKPVLVAATDIVAKEHLIEELRSLPDHGYAMLVTMIPEGNETAIACLHWPATKDTMAMHGFYNYTIDYLNHRVNGG